MRVFVMGDIHGAFKALKQCLKRSRFNYQKDRLIVLGDIVDRHDEVYECVEELLKIRYLIAVRGNHDDWLDEFCQTGRHPARWAHGGLATVTSYLRWSPDNSSSLASGYALTYLIKPQDIPKSHREFFSGMQPYYIDEQGRCFVHAGFSRFFPFTGQHPSIYYWDQDLWAAALEWQINKRLGREQPPFALKTRFEEVYLGHTSTTKWNITVPMQGANIYNVDTGAGGRGKLTIMEIETKKFWQSDPINELYGEVSQAYQ